MTARSGQCRCRAVRFRGPLLPLGAYTAVLFCPPSSQAGMCLAHPGPSHDLATILRGVEPGAPDRPIRGPGGLGSEGSRAADRPGPGRLCVRREPVPGRALPGVRSRDVDLRRGRGRFSRPVASGCHDPARFVSDPAGFSDRGGLGRLPQPVIRDRRYQRPRTGPAVRASDPHDGSAG